MIVEKLTDEDFNSFFRNKHFLDRVTGITGRELNLKEAYRIRRAEGRVEIDFGVFGTFYFEDFDFYNCYYDSEYYTLGHVRDVNCLHDERWVKFMCEHPVWGKEWKNLYKKRLEMEQKTPQGEESYSEI